jgi:bifunctional non-homologous end joining protein LigD
LVALPYQPMLLSPGPARPPGERWVHEPKLDGWRCLAAVNGGRARFWARGGREWSHRPGELAVLRQLGEVVLDGELVVASDDGRADFDLLSKHMRGSGEQVVRLYVFDALEVGRTTLVERPWCERRKVLEDLDLAGRTDGLVRPTLVSTNGGAMHQASPPRFGSVTSPTSWRP